ncbi:MAG TPA: tetratricopeptide repeat protein, partial [Chloroflexota bacterium]
SGQWRLHDLFRDFLRDHLRATDHAEWVRCHRRVARDLLAAGAHAEAITLLIDAGLDVEAADALAEHAEQIAAEGRWVAVRRWIADLPPRTIRARHKLLLLQARAHMQGGEIGKTLPLLDRAVEGCVAAGDRPAAATALAARAGRLAVSGRFDEALTDCRRAREMLAGQEHPALATAGRVEGLVAASQGDHERALGALAAALRVAQRCRDRAEVATCERSIGWVYSNSGQPGAAAAYYARAARIWDELDDLDQALEIRVSLGHVYLEQGADALARGTFEQARAAAERIGHQRMLSYALSNLGSLDRDAGNIEAAAQRFEAALEIARQKDDYQLIVLCVDHLAQCRLLLGDAGGAEALARQSLAEANRLDSPQLRGRARTTLAWALLARQDALAAARVATAAVDQQARTGTNRDRIRALLARALSRYLVREPGWSEDLRAVATTLSATPAKAFLGGLCRIADPHLRAMRADPMVRHAVDAIDALLSAGAAPPVAAVEPSRCDGRETLPVVHAKLLGRPAVTVDGAPPRDPDRSWGRMAIRELFYLLEAHRAGLSGDALIEYLWPDQPPGRAQALLWNHVTRLRALLGATNRREGRSIVTQADGLYKGLYKLHPDLQLVTDVAAFEAALVRADAAQPGSDEELEALAAADAAYTGEYLEGVDATWAIARRAALTRGYARVLHRSAQRHLATDPPEAVAYAERLLAHDPTSERACELMLRCLKAAGDPDRARQIYRAFASRLRDDLGIEPGSSLAALVAT